MSIVRCLLAFFCSVPMPVFPGAKKHLKTALIVSTINSVAKRPNIKLRQSTYYKLNPTAPKRRKASEFSPE